MQRIYSEVDCGRERKQDGEEMGPLKSKEGDRQMDEKMIEKRDDDNHLSHVM